ncbi:MAG: hypothetical protein AVDCRST_MAG05-4041, partial [uncultured Rubrobacteraceae bacterium]
WRSKRRGGRTTSTPTRPNMAPGSRPKTPPRVGRSHLSAHLGPPSLRGSVLSRRS